MLADYVRRFPVLVRRIVTALVVLAFATYCFELYGNYQDGLSGRPNPGSIMRTGAQAGEFLNASMDSHSSALEFDAEAREASADWTFSGYETEPMRTSGEPVTLTISGGVPAARSADASIDVFLNGCRVEHWTARSGMRNRAHWEGTCPASAEPIWKVAVQTKHVAWRVYWISCTSRDPILRLSSLRRRAAI